ncbi:hypothetical protein JTB14_021684 [Gonioctena quinquepunctata]|nr:hypothetical protein JTB14_021684 [Gonioctena quinquepunctata]
MDRDHSVSSESEHGPSCSMCDSPKADISSITVTVSSIQDDEIRESASIDLTRRIAEKDLPLGNKLAILHSEKLPQTCCSLWKISQWITRRINYAQTLPSTMFTTNVSRKIASLKVTNKEMDPSTKKKSVVSKASSTYQRKLLEAQVKADEELARIMTIRRTLVS